MVVRVYDKTKSMKEPQCEAVMFKSLRPDGSYRIDAGPFMIEMDASEKQNLIAEWALLERLFAEWRALGNVCDFEDESFLEFLTAGHRRAA